MPRTQMNPRSLANLKPREASPFWANVYFGSQCYEWMGSLDEKGYGLRTVDGATRKVHRVAWELFNGPIPRGMHVLHSCDNRRCVRHDHLRLGTHAENMAEMTARGRHPMQKVTHCRRGHEYTPETTRIYGTSRYCVACRGYFNERRRQLAAERKS